MRPSIRLCLSLGLLWSCSDSPGGEGRLRGDDADNDGFTADQDCDDQDPAIRPDADDAVGDGLDTNCDLIDGVDADGDGAASVASGGLDCDDADPSMIGLDADGDGAPNCIDCDDTDAAIRPGVEDLCDGVDADCDGAVDRAPDGLGACEQAFAVWTQVDVLMVVDNSCSMYEEQAAMSTTISAMYDAYVAEGADFHFGVVSTDMDDPAQSGRLREAAGSRWVDGGTADPIAKLQAMIQLGTGGSANERGIDAARSAIETHSQPGGYNEGFYRDEAVFEIVVLSDESDFSQTNGPTFQAWLGGLKTGGQPVVVNSIVSPDPVCVGAATPGTAYTQLAIDTGGVIWSVCETDYRPALEDAALTHLPAPTDSFTLDVAVDPTSLSAEVTTDGSTISYGAAELAWDAATFTVTLPAPVPPGSDVAIRYAIQL